MSAETKLPIHFDAANVLIDRELRYVADENVCTPFNRVRLITVNGEIYDKAFMPFNLTVAGVVNDWNNRTFDGWTRFDPLECPPAKFDKV